VQNLEQRNRGTKISSNEVKRLTEASISAVYDNEDLALALTTTINVIEALTEQTLVLERAVLKKARLRDEFEPLLSVWGIGKILALTIMYEAGDMNRFASPGNFASYCRCVDARRFSNGKKKADNNAKNGNAFLAWAFIEAAHFAVRFYPEAKRYHDRKAAKVNAIVAIKSVAHKLARAVFQATSSVHLPIGHALVLPIRFWDAMCVRGHTDPRSGGALILMGDWCGLISDTSTLRRRDCEIIATDRETPSMAAAKRRIGFARPY
jgi:hypothetical protein